MSVSRTDNAIAICGRCASDGKASSSIILDEALEAAVSWRTLLPARQLPDKAVSL